MLNVKTESVLNETALNNKMKELVALNGNNAVYFSETNYPQVSLPLDYQSLKAEAIAANTSLQSVMSQSDALRQQVSGDKQGWIPKLVAGYRLNT